MGESPGGIPRGSPPGEPPRGAPGIPRFPAGNPTAFLPAIPQPPCDYGHRWTSCFYAADVYQLPTRSLPDPTRGSRTLPGSLLAPLQAVSRKDNAWGDHNCYESAQDPPDPTDPTENRFWSDSPSIRPRIGRRFCFDSPPTHPYGPGVWPLRSCGRVSVRCEVLATPQVRP